MFNIGDRVVCLVDNPDTNESIVVGSTGTVCDISDEGRVGVNWDEEVESGHSCNWRCGYGHGWYVRPGQIKLECDDSVECSEIELLSFLEVSV